MSLYKPCRAYEIKAIASTNPQLVTTRAYGCLGTVIKLRDINPSPDTRGSLEALLEGLQLVF